MSDDAYKEIQGYAMERVGNECFLSDSIEDADFFDISVLLYDNDGNIEVIDEIEDIRSHDDACCEFDRIASKHPDAIVIDGWLTMT